MVLRRSRYFPRQLFRRYMVQQALVIAPLLFFLALLVRLQLHTRLSGFSTLEEAVKAYDRAFLFLALEMIIGVLLVSAWSGFRILKPLGGVLQKARRMQKRDYTARAADEEEDESSDTGAEWSDLDGYLHRIGRQMVRIEKSLSREREELEAIISAIAEAVIAVDREGNVLFYNSQFMVVFGIPSERQGRLLDFIRNPEVVGAFRDTLGAGVPITRSMRLRPRADQDFHHFALSVAPLKADEGQTYGAVGVFHDVSELKRMDQVRIDFVANVSHELRTPLTSIKGYAQTLKEDFPAENSSRKYLETIERNTDRLIALVQDLLTLSALDSGGDLQKETVNLRSLTDQIVAQLEPKRAERGQQLNVVVEVPTLWADPKRLEQVMINLLENTYKYSTPGGPIELSWTRVDSEVRLSVKDEGPGIPVEHHARIFERFYRVDSGRSRDQGGTGLGLAIVKHIVQRHGGKVKVIGGLGIGTEFICSFPAEGER